jgi:hypothetical protein
VADHEAAALGCFEQFQYCADIGNHGRHCTSWMEQNKIPRSLVRKLETNGEIDSLAELFVGFRVSDYEGLFFGGGLPGNWATFGSIPSVHSVYSYLGLLVQNFDITPLRFASSPEIWPKLDSNTEPAWMRLSFGS